MTSKNKKFIQLWKLGDTAIRNSYRVTGALKIFKMFFDGGPNFSGGDGLQQQLEFMKKLFCLAGFISFVICWLLKGFIKFLYY